MDNYKVVQQKAKAFYPVYERKAENSHQTHFCPGCGHGITHKLIARAIDELGVQDRTIMVSPVGCGVFAYYYFDTGNVQAAHGRASAVSVGLKRSLPGSIVISYQGDGDLAAIGSAEILHAANRGENISVIFINNAIYGMTGGQLAPTTPVGEKSTTTPFGRNIWNEGYPLRVSELLATLEAPVYIERVGLGNDKQIMNAAKAVRRALENQTKGLGFSLIEVLSPCPTIWKLKPVDAQKRIEELTKIFPLGVTRDRTKDAQSWPAPKPQPPLSEVAKILKIDLTPDAAPARNGKGAIGAAATRNGRGAVDPNDVRVKIAGFGGQGVLLLGEVLAEAGMIGGSAVSWLPSYGPEMRSGTSNCHVRISGRAVDSPLVSRPNILVAMNEPSLAKFIDSVQPGGWLFYNESELPKGASRTDVNVVALPFNEMADELGDLRAANIVILGAVLEATNILGNEQVDAALARHVKSQRWLDLDRLALERGRKAFRERTLA